MTNDEIDARRKAIKVAQDEAHEADYNAALAKAKAQNMAHELAVAEAEAAIIKVWQDYNSTTPRILTIPAEHLPRWNAVKARLQARHAPEGLSDRSFVSLLLAGAEADHERWETEKIESYYKVLPQFLGQPPSDGQLRTLINLLKQPR